MGAAPYQATVDGERWSLQYPFQQAQVAGIYTLHLSAEDKVGNQTALPAHRLVLDGAAPSMAIGEAASGLPTAQASFRFITAATALKGWLSDDSLPSGVRFVYPFDEGPGATTFENMVAGSGWLTSSAASCVGDDCPTAGVMAHAGLGLEFDGLYDYVTLPADIAQSDDFSFASWVYLRGPNPLQGQPILYAGQDDNRYLYITPHGPFNTPELVMTKDGPQNQQRLQAASSLPTDQWVHLAVTLQGDTGKFYVNGVEQGSQSYWQGVEQPGSAMTINPQEVAGAETWLGRPKYPNSDGVYTGFRGALDQVAIYHRALSGDEVRVLAATQVAGVQSGALSLTPLWAVERSGVSSPHRLPRLEGQTLHLPLGEASNPYSTTTSYRNLAVGDAAPASCVGDQCPEPGGRSPSGSAVHFDGQNDFITLPQSTAQSDDFTFAAWVYWRGGAAWQRIFDFGQDSTRYLFLTPSDASGKVRFAITENGVSGEQTLSANAAIPTDQWVHMAVSLVGDSGRIYINGVEQTNGAITSNPNQSAGGNLWLGRSQYGNDPYFNGDMSDVRVFSRGLSAVEIRSLWLGERALLSLSMDERMSVNADTLADESGWNQPAVLQSGASDPSNKAVLGHQGLYALNFDGQDDYVTLPAAAAQSDDFTFAAWVYWRGGAAWQRIFDFGRDTSNSIYLTPSGKDDTLYFQTMQEGAEQAWLQTDTVLPADRWVHVAVTLAGETGRIYVDGREVTSGPITIDPSQIAGGNTWLGRSQFTWDPYFNGMLDDVRVYPRALNSVEIGDLAGTGWRQVTLAEGSGWNLGVPADLEGNYRIDLRSSDQGAHVAYNELEPALNYTIDSLAPRVTFTRRTLHETGQTEYSFHAEDLYLVEEGLMTPCGGSSPIERSYRVEHGVQSQQQLTALTVSCQLSELPATENATVCDAAGNCATVPPTGE